MVNSTCSKGSNSIKSSFSAVIVSPSEKPADTVSICKCNLGLTSGGVSYLNPWSTILTDNALPTLDETGYNVALLPVELVTVTVGSERYPPPLFVNLILVISFVLLLVLASITS